MEPTSLKNLIGEGGVTADVGRLLITVKPSWIVEGESRVSYTTLIRLVECCREHHWNTDILPRDQTAHLDSITKSISGDFICPIPMNASISIDYRVNGVRAKGYSLAFTIHNLSQKTLCAQVNLICVFYDAISNSAVPPPLEIYQYLIGCVGD